MKLTQLSGMLVCAIVSVAMVSSAQAAQEDIAKYADPNIRVTQLMEGGGLVIVSSLNVLPNNDLLAIVFARQDQAAALGVKAVGKFAVLGRISKDSGQTWGIAFLILDSLADGSRTVVDPTTVVAGGTWSHDGGRSWEPPQPGKLHEFNTPTGLWRMKNGWVMRLWNNSKTARRMPLVVAISKDNCRTWSAPRTLVGFPNDSKWPVQASYPSVVEAADGTLVAVWCHVTPEGKWLWASGGFTVDWALGK